MKNRALIIDDAAQRRIDEAVAKARANPTSLEAIKRAVEGIPQVPVIKLEDRPPDYKPPMQAQQVLIPNGYRAAISFEYQRPGLCAHLSISVDTPGNLPSPESVELLAEVFGLQVPLVPENTTLWIEEFDPGHQAVNLLQTVK